MAIFESYPYVNQHNLNLDWVIAEMQTLRQEVADYAGQAAANTITYADPIQWDILTAYDKNVLVLDSDYTAYLSIRAVPAGITLANTDYWLEVGDFYQKLEDALNLVAYNQENNSLADQNYAVGDLLILNDKLYVVTAAIASGYAITEGTNVTETTIETLFTNVQSQIDTINNTLEDLHPQVRIHDHDRYYIDGTNGDDDNDGLTSATAFKTVDRFLELADRQTEIRCYFITAGTYDCTAGNNFSNINIHFEASVAGVILRFTPDSGSEVSVYSCHWNLQGVSSANRLTIELTTGNTDGRIYFDNSLVTAQYVTFNCGLGFYHCGAYLTTDTCYRMSAVASFVDITGGISILNTSNTVSALYFECCHVKLFGAVSLATLSANGASASSSICIADGSTLCVGSTLAAASSKYYYGYNTNHSIILCTAVRITATGNNCVNGNSFTNSYQLTPQ